jgi:hypothetical protein
LHEERERVFRTNVIVRDAVVPARVFDGHDRVDRRLRGRANVLKRDRLTLDLEIEATIGA